MIHMCAHSVRSDTVPPEGALQVVQCFVGSKMASIRAVMVFP